MHPLPKPGRACPLLGVAITPSSIAWACSWSAEPTSSSSTPSGASKAAPKGSVGLESVAISAHHFWMELMGEKGILSSCHSPSPRGTAVSPLWGKELEVPSYGCSHSGGQCYQWGQLN